jgi:hypothetical protein
MRLPSLAAIPLLAVLLLSTLTFSSGSAQAASERQCMPKSAEQSLVVKGETTCKKVKRILPSMREYALHTVEYGVTKFRAQGYRCKLRNGDPDKFTCRDANGKPKRSFTWVDRT